MEKTSGSILDHHVVVLATAAYHLPDMLIMPLYIIIALNCCEVSLVFKGLQITYII